MIMFPPAPAAEAQAEVKAQASAPQQPVQEAEETVAAESAAPRGAAAGVGCISWLDLTVQGAATARDFYREVVGWKVEDVGMKDGDDGYADYNMLGGDGNPAAGVCHARGVNLGLPPIWMIYLPVGDLAESLRRVQEEGGKVIKATRRTDGEYAYAAVQDPVGACLALVPG